MNHTVYIYAVPKRYIESEFEISNIYPSPARTGIIYIRISHRPLINNSVCRLNDTRCIYTTPSLLSSAYNNNELPIKPISIYILCLTGEQNRCDAYSVPILLYIIECFMLWLLRTRGEFIKKNVYKKFPIKSNWYIRIFFLIL